MSGNSFDDIILRFNDISLRQVELLNISIYFKFLKIIFNILLTIEDVFYV